MSTFRVVGEGWSVTQTEKFVVLSHRRDGFCTSCATYVMNSEMARKIARALSDQAAECDLKQLETTLIASAMEGNML